MPWASLSAIYATAGDRNVTGPRHLGVGHGLRMAPERLQIPDGDIAREDRRRHRRVIEA
jgi:hypothetical protein